MFFSLVLFGFVGTQLHLAGKVSSQDTPPTAIDTRNNITYHGVHVNQVEKFFNIPYGRAERFGNPEPYNFPSNKTLYDASVRGPVCPQPPGSASIGWEQSEDCLRLKVARPEGVKMGDKLPVMVFIYGGSMFAGSINDPRHEPDSLVLQSVENGLPVVYIAMNYRLNIFGFAISDSLRANNSLNVGLKDQRLALEWVQQNIEYFGGDPERMTILGQSSGGLSVANQILAYGGSRPVPFHAAIMQSTALEPGSTSNVTVDSFNDVVRLAGCDFGDSGSPQSSKSLDCLRALPFQTLLNYAISQRDSTADQNFGDIYLPTVDGDFVPLSSSQLTNKGLFPKIPLMIGWTDQDLTILTPPTLNSSSETRTFIGTMFPGLTNDTVSTILELYPSSDFPPNKEAGLSSEFYRSAQIFRDGLLVCPSFLFGHAMARKYDNGDEVPSVYYYDQNQIPPGYLGQSAAMGVFHGADAPYAGGLRVTEEAIEVVEWVRKCREAESGGS
ncbi:hypothetical protein PQX77_011253 [Marasmius sp. AFHP31]|nr:hypothetical protein PQX77_011253 [Marasmius sp. AFHP31]